MQQYRTLPKDWVADDWDFELTPLPRLSFVAKSLPVDRFEYATKTKLKKYGDASF